jgi:Xaa-Pro aminopeptidase
MFNLDAVQSALREFGFDAWLLYDFRGSNILARRILDLADKPITSRRWFYLIPAHGEPRKLVHRIETAALDHLPGRKSIYLRWQELEDGVSALVHGHKKLAMEYVPRNANPYISRVDGGTIDLVKSAGPAIEPSGDLIQLFVAAWSEAQWQMHREAEIHTKSAFDLAFSLIAQRTQNGGSIHELEVQAAILEHFQSHGLTTYSPPIVGVNAHSGDPHYEPQPGDAGLIHASDFVLIDLWAKLNHPAAVYSDLTRVGYVGHAVPDKFAQIFAIVAQARDAAIARVEQAFADSEPLQGYQVDDACRAVIDSAGFGKYFVHRTGHSIGQEVHGNGANMDNLETHETRLVLPGTCFSVEPGIYLPEFGVRSEVNVFVHPDRSVHVTGGLQTRVLPILANPNASGE